VRFDLTGDELILTLVSLVRAIDPRMLRQGAEGYEMDFQALEGKKELSADEVLVLKLRAALDRHAAAGSYGLEFDAGETRRLSQTLERLESLQPWPEDVLQLSRALRARLSPVV